MFLSVLRWFCRFVLGGRRRYPRADSLPLLVLLCFAGLGVATRVNPASAAGPPATVQFTDVTRAAGIDFRLRCGSPEKRYIMEAMCGGIAFLDYDNDGWMDIFLLNGSTLEDMERGSHPASKLYRNHRDGTFTDVTEPAGLLRRGWGMGVAVGDYDHDGWTDLYLTYFGGAVLYRNQGDGTFGDVTKEAGVDNGGRWGTSAAFGDYDQDGDLDLYVANYVTLDLKRLPEFGSTEFCQYRGIPVSCGPRGLAGARDRLYRNNGDGTFTDVAEALEIDPNGYYGLGVVWGDYDNDGDLDLYVANDSTPSFLYRNQGDGTFTEVGLLAGVALSADGLEQAGMGVDFGDYDNDGWLDLVKTNFSDDTNNLYRNQGESWFEDVGGAAGYAAVSRPLLGFGIKFFDYDNDGWKDIFVANGHVNPQVDAYAFGVRYAERNLLFRNLRDGRFEEVGLDSGAALRMEKVSRGAASADFDNDGDLDLLVSNLDEGPTLYRNDGGHGRGHWIRITLVGSESNREGLGARVEVVAGALRQVEEVRANASYLAASDPRLHFGLGEAAQVERITIRWPSGKVEAIENEKGDQELVIEEGRGVVARIAPGRGVPGPGLSSGKP